MLGKVNMLNEASFNISCINNFERKNISFHLLTWD